jgi:hypothetical protein
VRVGEIYFVRDGHHRVSVALALGRSDIDAYVTEVVTRVGADGAITHASLPTKSLQREFFERVPLPDGTRDEISFSNPWDYAVLAEAVEAWGFRASQDLGDQLDRPAAARMWLEREYHPVIAMLREADLIGQRTDAEAYLGVAEERYRLMRTHSWSDDVLQRLTEGKGRRRPFAR